MTQKETSLTGLVGEEAVEMTAEVISITPDGVDLRIKIKVTPNWFQKLLGCKQYEAEFIGSCTVWHRLPDFYRAGTIREFELCRIWTKWNYNNRKAPQKEQG